MISLKAIFLLLTTLFLNGLSFSQQVYLKGTIGDDSTPLDTALIWYSSFEMFEEDSSANELELAIEPTKLLIKRDSTVYIISTSSQNEGALLFGFKDSVNNGDIQYDHAKRRRIEVLKRQTHYFGKTGIVQLKAEGSPYKHDWSVKDYQLTVTLLDILNPKNKINWNDLDTCLIINVTSQLDLDRTSLPASELPYFLGAIKLKNQRLLILEFESSFMYYYLILEDTSTNEKVSYEFLKTIRINFLDY